MGYIRWYRNDTFSNSRKIAPLCGENLELSIFESGKGIYITSKNIKENLQLFVVYNPFNKGSKMQDPV